MVISKIEKSGVIFTVLLLSLLMQSGNTYSQVKLWTLKECISRAFENNIQLNQNQLNGKINQINFDQARMNAYPNLNFSDNQTFSFGYSTDPYTGQSSKQNITANNFSLNSSITLFGGFQNRYSIEQGKFNLDAGNLDIEKTRNDIMLNVVSSYMQVLYAHQALQIANTQLLVTAGQVERTKKFVDAGKLAESNLYQVQYQYSQDKVTVVNAENNLQLAKLTLKQLMEMKSDEPFETDTNDIAEPTIQNIQTSEDIYKISEGIMPEIKSSELKSLSYNSAIKIAQSSSYPKLTLGGSLKSGYSSSQHLYSTSTIIQQEENGYLANDPAQHVINLVPTVITTKDNYPFGRQISDNFGQVVTLNLNVPIFNNLQSKNNTEKARINYENARLNEQSTKNQLRKSVEQALTDMNGAIKNYLAVQEGLKSEEKAYRDIEKKFGLGLVSATDFLIEKNNYNKATISVLQAKYNYIFKAKIVDFYLGKSLIQ